MVARTESAQRMDSACAAAAVALGRCATSGVTSSAAEIDAATESAMRRATNRVVESVLKGMASKLTVGNGDGARTAKRPKRWREPVARIPHSGVFVRMEATPQTDAPSSRGNCFGTFGTIGPIF